MPDVGTEVGAQCVLSDDAWKSEETKERARNMLRQAMARAGVDPRDVHFDEDRRYMRPTHISDVDCPYLEFKAANPGADANEYPECGNDEHWDKGMWVNSIDAWGIVAISDVEMLGAVTHG